MRRDWKWRSLASERASDETQPRQLGNEQSLKLILSRRLFYDVLRLVGPRPKT